MATRQLRAVGAADPNTAWRRYVDIAAWPTWSPQITRVEAPTERIGLGVSGRVHVLGGFRLPFTITSVEEQSRSWSWLVRLGPAAMTLNHRVDPQERGSSTVLVMEGPDAVLLGYAPLAWVALRRLVAR